jgi:flagellar motility protein MotE (MotC chaperone)
VNSRTYQALQQERTEITAERQKLQAEKAQLELFRRDLEAKKDDVRKEREKIEGLVSRSDSLGRKKTAQLAKMYAAMRPAEAAQIIGTLKDELAADIIDGISDDRQKAKILASLPAEKATRLTQLMGGTKR